MGGHGERRPSTACDSTAAGHADDGFARLVSALCGAEPMEVGRALVDLRGDEAQAHRALFPRPLDCREGSPEHALEGIRWLNLRHAVVLGDPVLYA